MLFFFKKNKKKIFLSDEKSRQGLLLRLENQ